MTSATLRLLLLVFATSLVAQETASEFPQLLDALERAATPMERGFDQGIRAFNRTGNRVIQLLGAPENWDAYGTQELRAAVIERWRRRWKEEGPAMLQGLQKVGTVPGEVEVNAADIRFSRKIRDMRALFFLTNQRLYEIGAMDGAFPPAGFMLGDQSGLWVPPVKILDKFAFTLRETGKAEWRLIGGSRFHHDFASASFFFEREGLTAERRDFPDAENSILFSSLTVANQTGTSRTIDVEFGARFNIRPDWRTAAQKREENDLDIIQCKDGIVSAWDPRLKRSLAVLLCDHSNLRATIKEPVARLTCQLVLSPQSRQIITFAIGGGFETDNDAAVQLMREATRKAPDALKTQRTRVIQRVQQGVRFTCSDPELTEAFALSKANLGLLVADHRPYFPELFLQAGLPVYPRLFACDACIALPGVIAAGFWKEGHGTIAALAEQARKYNNLVPHESATDGALIGPSNAQETTEFIATCWRYYQWTGDSALLVQMYPLLSDALRAHLERFDKKKTGYPVGSALAETQGMGPKRLDAACWQYAALLSLANIAGVLGKSADATSFQREADALGFSIQKDWWLPSENIWADAMNENNVATSHGLWTVVFPLLTGVASPKQRQFTLEAIEHEWINQWGGVHTRKSDITSQGSGVVTSNLFAIAAFAGEKGETGLSLLRKASQAVRQEGMPGAFTEMIPPGGSDFIQLWSVGPFLEAVIEGLAGIRTRAAEHRVDLIPSLPATLDWYRLENLRVGAHTITLHVARQNGRVTATLTQVTGPTALRGTWKIASPGTKASQYQIAPGETVRLP